MEVGSLNVAHLTVSAVEELQDGVATVASHSRVHRFKDLWLDKDYEQRFLIENLIPSGAVSILIGDDGIGKTQLLTSLGLAVAFGESVWLNQELKIVNPGCMIVATEDSRQKFTGAMVKQVNSQFQKHLKENPDPNFFFMEGADYDDWVDFCNTIEKHVQDDKLGLVVIDALSDLFGLVNGDINDNSIARRILKRLQAITDKYDDLSIIVIHHASKSKISAKHREGKIFVEKFDSQGAGAITQKARTVLALSNDPKGVSADSRTTSNYLHVVKANLMGKRFVQNAIRLEFDTWNLTHKYAGEVNIELTELELASGADQPEGDPNFTIRPSRMDENDKKITKGFTQSEHRLIVNEIFPDYETYYERGELVDKLIYAYGATKNKVTAKNGHFQELLNLNMIQDTSKGFKKTYIQESKTSFVMPQSSMFEVLKNNENDDDIPF